MIGHESLQRQMVGPVFQGLPMTLGRPRHFHSKILSLVEIIIDVRQF